MILDGLVYIKEEEIFLFPSPECKLECDAVLHFSTDPAVKL